jgi:hypothetical protein
MLNLLNKIEKHKIFIPQQGKFMVPLSEVEKVLKDIEIQNVLDELEKVIQTYGNVMKEASEINNINEY